MKKFLAICLSVMLLVGMVMPSFAAEAKVDKTHAAFFQKYVDTLNELNVKKLSAFYASKDMMPFQSDDEFVDFETIRDLGVAKFYLSDNFKLVKQDKKRKTYTYTFDMYFFISADVENSQILKMPAKLAIKQTGKTFVITADGSGDAVTILDSSKLPKKVLSQMNKDCLEALQVNVTDLTLSE